MDNSSEIVKNGGNGAVIFRIGIPKPQEVEAVANQLAMPPRQLISRYEGRSAFLKNFLIIISSAAFAGLSYLLFTQFRESDNDLLWIVAVSIVLPIYIYSLYKIIKTYRARILNFRKARRLYEGGEVAFGLVNTLTFFDSGEYQNYYLQMQKKNHKHSFVRVDYSFQADGKTWVNTNCIKSQYARYLKLNSPIVILYFAAAPQESMIYPVPLSSFQSLFFHTEFA